MDFEQNPYEVEPIEQPQPRAVTTRGQTHAPALEGRFFNHWTTSEIPERSF